MKKRILGLALALVLSLALLPAPARAEGQTVVQADSEEALSAAIASNTRIVLEAKDYSIGYMSILGVENLTIQGVAGTRLLTQWEGNLALAIDCPNLTLENLTIALDPPEDTWHDTGLWIMGLSDESRVTVQNCKVTGCYLSLAMASGSVLTMKDTQFSGSARGIMRTWGGRASFERCTFSGSGAGSEYRTPTDSAITCPGDVDGAGLTQLVFTDCKFENNKNAAFIDSKWTEANACTLTNCAFTGNSWGNDTTPTAPAPKSAAPTSAAVLVNGAQKSFDAYSIDGNNYFKLRDLAYVLSGTEKQFEVGWDAGANSIELTSGQPYTAVGGEMAAGNAQVKNAVPSAAKLLLNGEEVSLTAYSIAGNNYFKLRDIGELIDFGIGWDAASRTITIETSTGYTA